MTDLTDINRSNSLADLAARIKAEHMAAAGALRRTLQHAMAAGDLLLEAKAQLRHGEWLPWLEAHCQIPERTARLYMRIARNRAELEHQNGNVADLSVRGAVALLASPLDSLASQAADSEIETLDLAAAERASAQIEIRYKAYRDAGSAIEEIISLNENTSVTGQAVWDQLGDQLNTAIAHCTKALEADLEEPFALSLAATAAILDARDIANEMLRRVRNGGTP
jgi:hypothetical protein